MTTAEMLAEVTAQIRKDIPRLMELREGCLIEYFKGKCAYNCKVIEIFPSYFNVYLNGEIKGIDFELSENTFQIIGHDIMLNDVLEWLKYLGFLTECSNINFDGNTFCKSKLIYDNDDNFLYKKTTFCEWNLSTPYLKDQSEELIKFLYELIKE